VFAAVPCFVPLEITADALLNLVPEGQVPSGAGPSLEDGFLRSWRGPFAFLVIAGPVSPERHRELLDTVALDQLKAQRQDTPRAQLAEKRRRARHEEFRRALSTGLWEVWPAAGAESPEAAAEVAALLAASLDLRGLSLGLTERRDLAAPLPELLGAPASITDGRGHGPLTREALEMFGGGDPRALRPRTTPLPPGNPETVPDSPSWTTSGAERARQEKEAERRQREARAAEVARNEAAARARREAGEAGRARRQAAQRQPWQDTPGIPGMPGATANDLSELSGYPGPPPAGFTSGPPGGLPAPGDFRMPPPPLVAGPGNEAGAPPGPGTGPRPAWLGGAGPGGPQPRPSGPPLSAAAQQPDFSDPEPEFPAIVGSESLAALAVPPAKEVPGVRLTLQPQFDATPETDPDAPGAIVLGTVLDGSRLPAGPFAVTEDSLNRHVFVCGATGSGKSQTVRNILEALAAKGIPWLVIEPAKAEYRRMAARLPGTEVIVIRPGDPDAVAAGINPLEPALGPDGTRYPLQVHADLVRGLFLAAFQAEEPFPQVLAQALDRVYREAGWDLVSGEPAAPGTGYPDLGDLQAAAMKVVDDIGYGKEVRDNIRGFVAVRIGSLQSGTTGRFLSGRFPIDFGKLLSGNVVLEVEDAGDDMDKAFLIGSVLVRLNEFLRLRDRAEAARKSEAARIADGTGDPGEAGDVGEPRKSGLRHVTVVEEAHRLLRQPPEGAGAGAAAKAVEMFADVLAEIRAYGEGIIIAEQIPTKVISDAIKNTAVKLMHRLPALDDREAVGSTMNMGDSQSEFVTTLLPGEAAAFADGMDFPVLIRLPDGSDRENEGGARAAVPDGLVAGSRPACPEECAATACTLRALSAAARTAEKDQRIILWAEITVAAHLTGGFMPSPRAALAKDLKAMDRRHRDCVIATAVEAAVASRVPALSARIAGPALAAHCAAAMRSLLERNRWLCAGSEPEWTAPSFLWDRILRRLQRYESEHHGQGPHPSTAEWEDGCGEDIPGATCAQQIAVVQQRDAAARRDPRAVRTVLLGNRSPSALENAVGSTAGDPAWRGKLATALTVLDSKYDWSKGLLSAPGDPS
jgi:hypothetical protein